MSELPIRKDGGRILTRVGSRGPINTDILIVGEAPGRDEEASGVPFAGGSGREAERMLAEAGIDPNACRWTNVCKYRPPGDDISKWFYTKAKAGKFGGVQMHDRYVHPLILEGYGELLEEIRTVKPKMIICFGNVAMWALTQKWGITKWRGSELHHGEFKVLPTYHPAAILRQWSWRAIAVADLRRARSQADRDGAWPQKPYVFTIRPSFDVVMQTLKELESRRCTIAVDLETRGGHIACCGIAWSDTEAICIPFMDARRVDGYWTLDEECAIIAQLRNTFFACEIVGQNFLYDMQYIVHWWMMRPRCAFDTMIAQHVVWPDLPKGLDFLSSMYCERHVYWKDEGKTFDLEHHDEEQLWTYCCKDACTTFEVRPVLQSCIDHFGLAEVFAFQMRMFEWVLDTMLDGVRVDEKLRGSMIMDLLNAMNQYAEWFDSVIAPEVHTSRKGTKNWWDSPQQQMTIFYETLGVKPVIKRATGRWTCDDDALTRIGQREPLLKPLCKALSNYRSLGVLMRTFLTAPLDHDRRLRCSYNIAGTRTYRLSSSENAFGRGTNLQNITAGDPDEDDDESRLLPSYLPRPNLRRVIVPDPDHYMIEMDLERADLYVVVWEADDEKLKEVLRSGANVHIENAKDIFGGNPVKSASPDSPYHKAKQGVHATNYGATPTTLARHLGITVHEAERFQARWFAAHPGIREWQRRVQDELHRTRGVSNRYGFRITFFDRAESILPEALAWVPQSTVAITINKGWDNIRRTLPWVRVALQVHDSLTVQIPRNRIRDLWQIHQCMLIRIPYPDPLVIPVSASISDRSWGDCEPLTGEMKTYWEIPKCT